MLLIRHVQQVIQLRQVGRDDIRQVNQFLHLCHHLLGDTLVKVTVVTQHRVHHHHVVLPTELQDKLLHNLCLLRRTQITRVESIEVHVHLLPVLDDALHLVGQVEERVCGVLRMCGQHRRGQRTHLKAHGRKHRNDRHQ